MNPKVYILLLNYNGSNDTIECLESLYKLEYNNFQVLVVDNSHTREPYDRLLDWANGKVTDIPTDFKELVYPLETKPVSYAAVEEKDFLHRSYTEKVVFIKAEANEGFACGNNIGLSYVVKYGEANSFAWLLNNDTITKKNALTEQVNYLAKSEKRIGILGSRLLYYYNPVLIQGVGGKFNTTTFLPGHVGHDQPAESPKEQFEPIDYTIGASMLTPIAFLKETGLLGEDYFLYYEELDWAYRAHKKNWEIDWCPTAIIYHKEGGSIGTSSDYKTKSRLSDIETFRSRKIFYAKHFNFRPSFYFFSLLIIANRIKRGQLDRAAEYFKILFSKPKKGGPVK